jgi:hypothetical protein
MKVIILKEGENALSTLPELAAHQKPGQPKLEGFHEKDRP